MRDWKTIRLGEVCEMINRGIAPKYIEEGGICVINQKCIRDHSINTLLARRHNIEQKPVPRERLIKLGDVLVNSTGTGTLGRVAQVRKSPSEPTTVDTHVTIVRPYPNKFYPDFFGYMLIKIEDEIAISGEGASGQTELSRIKLAEGFQVSYPESIDEQKRIVEILDEAFEGIDRAIANTEKNLANARKLFESYLNAIFTQKNEHLERVKLVDLCEPGRVITYGVIKLGDHLDQGVPCLRTSNVRWLDIDTSGMKCIALSLSENYKRTILRGGEVLVNVRGTLGGVAVVKPDMAGWNISREVALVPIDSKKVHPAYLAYFIGARTNQEWLQGVQKGAAYTGINLEDLRTLPVVVPDYEEQERLIASLEDFHAASQRLEAIYQQKLAALNELKQSILQKAFTGELTADTSKQVTQTIQEFTAA